jgi:hypothetical protein
MIELCDKDSHDWHIIGKCKDVLGKHPCKYFPEGCNTCMTRFECYTKDTDTYRNRESGILYACNKCPAVRFEGTISSWVTHNLNSIIDIRKEEFVNMDKNVVKQLQSKWQDK